MIAVVADDLTGAAELGGIGLRYGLKTEVSMSVNADTKAELLVVAADTRSMGREAAVAEMATIAGQLKAMRPEWIYKKVDSVLRGHIVAEMQALMAELGLAGGLLIPANPLLGRTVRDGHYFLHGKPVNETSFAVDPEFAITSSDVREMLRVNMPGMPQANVEVRKIGEDMPANGIIVGEVSAGDDLVGWAARISTGGRGIEEKLLPAGAAGFFSALLAFAGLRGGMARVAGAPPFGSPVLFVSGTTFEDNRAIVRRLHLTGGPVRYLSDDRWMKDIVGFLRDGRRAVIAIDERHADMGAVALRGAMAEAVNEVLQEVDVHELVIEGGATAYAILQRMGLSNFYPVEELAPGVVRMRAGGLFVTVKPGSYRWPETIKY